MLMSSTVAEHLVIAFIQMIALLRVFLHYNTTFLQVLPLQVAFLCSVIGSLQPCSIDSSHDMIVSVVGIDKVHC